RFLLPFRYRSVLLPPYRISPSVADRGHLPHLLFVHFDPEPGPCQIAHKTVFISEYGGIFQIVEQIRTLIVMNAEALLLDECIRRARVQLQASGEGDRTERAVRR